MTGEAKIRKPDQQKRSLAQRIRGLFRLPFFRQLTVLLLGSLVVILATLLAISPMRYDLSVGMVPTVTIAATRDVVDEVSTEYNRSLAAAAVTPTYKYQEGVTEQVIASLDSVFAQYSAVRQYAQTLPDYSASRRYEADELEYAADMLTLVSLRDYQLVTLLNAPQEQFDELTVALKAALRNTLQGYVTQGQESIAINSIMQIVGFKTNISLLQNVVLPTLKAVVLPNMTIDQEQTNAARETSKLSVEPVIYKQGQNIVVRGEGRIKQNQIAMLNSLGLLSSNRADYRLYWGTLLVAGLSLLGMILWLRLACPKLFTSSRRLILIFLLLLLTAILAFVAKSLQGIYLAPMVLPAMLLTLMLGFQPALIVQVCASVIGAMILGLSPGASLLDLLSLLSGAVVALALSVRKQRPMIFVASALAMLTGFLCVLGLGLVNSNSAQSFVDHALYAIGGAALSTALCLALQPVLERLFNLPTYNRLMELSNPNHPLLRRLLLEAPGTYHHSILIANLAEASAEAIGANALLARVGGYYHDIGKLKRPLYFKENQIGSGNVHDSTDPSVSAAIITSHTRDGLALAKQFRLPQEVQEVIAEHHGNSKVAYFYTKALKEAKEAVDEDDFRYDGHPPQSAETSIVMLCDTIEAAVRTLNNPSPEDIQQFISKLVQGKMEDGQLDDAPLTMQDLHTIQQSCATIIHGIFHERIEYPASDKKTALERIRQSLHTPDKPTEDKA